MKAACDKGKGSIAKRGAVIENVKKITINEVDPGRPVRLVEESTPTTRHVEVLHHADPVRTAPTRSSTSDSSTCSTEGGPARCRAALVRFGLAAPPGLGHLHAADAQRPDRREHLRSLALGYTLVYGVLKLLNFAHGDVFMVGSFIGFGVLEVLGGASDPVVPVWLLLTLMVLGSMIGAPSSA